MLSIPYHLALEVHCLTGSLEKLTDIKGALNGVHCLTGSLEKGEGRAR